MMPDPKKGQISLPSNGSWLEFASSIPEANIFHHPAWSKVLVETYGYSPFTVVTKDANGEITAGIPFMRINLPLRGVRWTALPFSDHCIPLSRDMTALEKLSNTIIQAFGESNLRSLEIRADLSFNPSFHRRSDFVIHRLTLLEEIEAVHENIHHMHRRNIENAEKNEIEVRVQTDLTGLKEFYRLHLENRRQQGIPVQPWRFFRAIKQHLFNKNLGFLLNAYSNNKCVSTALFLHWRDTLSYKFGASNSEDRVLRANNKLFWTAIRWGCERGYSRLDFGKTQNTNQGLREFKSRWGAEETPLVYSYSPSIPPSTRDNSLMWIAGVIIRNSPLFVNRVLGETLYRYVG